MATLPEIRTGATAISTPAQAGELSPPTPGSDEWGIARIDLGQPPANLDPVLVTPLDASANDLVENLFIGLAQLDPDTGLVEPALATEWKPSDDGLTWRISLRDDVFWIRFDPDTGQTRVRPVTAEDVVFAVQRACRADSGALLGWQPGIFAIRGCQEVHQQDPAALTSETVEQTIGVRALDDLTVEFTLVAEAAYFPSVLTIPMLRPVPPELIEAAGSEWTRPNVIWTSGPYAVQPSIPADEGYTLIANEHWPLERSGNVGVVQITFDTAGEGALSAWKAGSLDLTAIPAAEIASALSSGDPAYRLLAQPAVAMLVVSHNIPPLDQPDIRRALSLALDRDSLIRDVLAASGQAGIPALTAIPPGMAAAPQYEEVSAGHNPEAARATLAQAGYPACNGLPPITVWTDNAFPVSIPLVGLIVRQWEDTLGCSGVFIVEEQSLPDLYAALRQPFADVAEQPGLILLGWQADYPDAQHWLADIFACRDLFPHAYLGQERACTPVDQQIFNAATERDVEVRSQLYADAEEALFGSNGEMPVIPLYFHARLLAIQPWLAVYPSHAGPLRFDRWTVNLAQQP